MRMFPHPKRGSPMMVTKQTLHVAGIVRSPQLQYELSEALREKDGT